MNEYREESFEEAKIEKIQECSSKCKSNDGYSKKDVRCNDNEIIENISMERNVP